MARGVKGTAEHGTTSRYVLGCREDCCRLPWNAYCRANQRAYRARKRMLNAVPHAGAGTALSTRKQGGVRV